MSAIGIRSYSEAPICTRWLTRTDRVASVFRFHQCHFAPSAVSRAAGKATSITRCLLCGYETRRAPRRGTGRCRRRGRLGSWAPAFGDAGLGRLGEWRPPGPSCFRFCFSVFFAPMRDCRAVWLSVARQCGAAELRSVTWFYLFVVCCVFFCSVRLFIFSFSFLPECD